MAYSGGSYNFTPNVSYTNVFMHLRRFFVYFPPQAEKGKVPVLYYLSGLTCTDENFTQKVCIHCNVVVWTAAQYMSHHLSQLQLSVY